MSNELLIRAADMLRFLAGRKNTDVYRNCNAIAAELEAMAKHLTPRMISGWEIAAESWHDVEAFCRQHPGERVTLLAVPIEPTPEMLDAVAWPNVAKTDYAHMLAAAPKPEMKE